jgi:hypothetical protein
MCSLPQTNNHSRNIKKEILKTAPLIAAALSISNIIEMDRFVFSKSFAKNWQRSWSSGTERREKRRSFNPVSTLAREI